MGRRLGIGLALAAALLVLAAAGCGRGDRAPGDGAAAGTPGYHLDPPDLAPVLVGGEDGVPVLCYHYFRKDFQPLYMLRVLGSLLFGMPALGDREFWTTPRAEFERHLAWFRDTGTRVMTLDEVADLLDAGRPLPPRAVVITIDDADRSVYEIAWPLLRKYRVRAHLFVPTAKVGDPWSGLDVCTWEQLKEMGDSGTIVLESHAHDLHFKVRAGAGREPVFWHPDALRGRLDSSGRESLARRWQQTEPAAAGEDPRRLLTGPWSPVADDLVTSRVALIEQAGRAPRWLAWPYGFAHGELDSVAHRVGFRGTVSLRPRVFGAADSTLQVGRLALTAKTTMDELSAVWPKPVPAP